MVKKNPHVEVVRVTDKHAGAIACFFRHVGWDLESTEKKVLAARESAAATNPVEPGMDIPTFAFISDDVIVGYITTIPVQMWDGANETSAYWMKGFMVLEEYRNGPVGFMVLKEAIRQVELAGSLVVAEPARRLLQAMGFVDQGVLGNYISILRPAKVLHTLDFKALNISRIPGWLVRMITVCQRTGLALLAGYIIGPFLYFRKMIYRTGFNELTIETDREKLSIDELDVLWKIVRQSYTAAPVRNGVYMKWRYMSDSEQLYSFVTVHENNKLAGVAVVRKPKKVRDERLKGIRLATLSDILYPADRKDIGRALLMGAEKQAKNTQADVLLCSASYSSLQGILLKQGYISVPGNIHFLLRTPDMDMPNGINNWWITRGDGNSDEVF